jgi:hypothetical protein
MPTEVSSLHAAPAHRRCRLPPGLIRAAQAAAWCSVGPRTWRTWDTAGRMRRPIRINACVLWSLSELRAWRDAGCPDRRTWEALRAAERNGQHPTRHAGRSPG